MPFHLCICPLSRPTSFTLFTRRHQELAVTSRKSKAINRMNPPNFYAISPFPDLPEFEMNRPSLLPLMQNQRKHIKICNEIKYKISLI